MLTHLQKNRRKQPRASSKDNHVHWCRQEFRSVEFGDPRLTRRFISLADQLAHQPLNPINQACRDRSESKAAYRFFANESTSAESILEAHRRETLRRIAREKEGAPVLVVQDTSFLDYTSHLKTQDLGKIGRYMGGKNKGRGLVMHTSLVLSEEGLPLGIIHQQIWARPAKPSRARMARRYRTPIEEKESFKWLKAVRESMAFVRLNAAAAAAVEVEVESLSKREFIHVADREADIFEFLEEVIQSGAHFVVRAKTSQDRVVIHEGDSVRGKYGTSTHTLLKDLEKEPAHGEFEIEVPRRAGNTNSAETLSRKARVELRFCPVKIALPRRQSIRLRGPKLDHEESRKQALERALGTNAIWLKEIGNPKGTEAINWLLLTDLPVENATQAIEKVRWYQFRWRIESLHKILKSGCRVEDCRLETAERLKKYLTLFSVIAWRILWMTQVSRRHPDAPCVAVLSESEWKALYCRIHETSVLPRSPPSTYQVIRWIAQLGGFLGRKCDGEPGMITLWRGLHRLTDITETWEIIKRAA